MDDVHKTSLDRLIALARDEDFGSGDLSTNLLPDPDQLAAFELLAEEPGVFAGCTVAAPVLQAYDRSIEIRWTDQGQDGKSIEEVPANLATITGPLGSILSAERILLNFLQRLCGVATLTRRYVDEISGTGAQLLDTRKTTPGWRMLEKYAVRCGGGLNHRRGLFDAVLIKDNHLADVSTERLADKMREMLDRLSSQPVKPTFVEVEADTIAQAEELLKVPGVDVILLDNFSPDELREAVALRRRLGAADRVQFEASGGVTLKTIRSIAETGVERISVGAITHSATALSLHLERVQC